MVHNCILTQLDSPGIVASGTTWTGLFLETAQSPVVTLLKALLISLWNSAQVEWINTICHAHIKIERSSGSKIVITWSGVDSCISSTYYIQWNFGNMYSLLTGCTDRSVGPSCKELAMPGMLLGVAFTAMGKTVWRATKPVIFMWIDRLSSLITSIFSLEMPCQRDSIFSALEERTRRAIRTSALFSSENSLRLPTMCWEFRLLLQKS
jgi:hypothetical protein